MGGCANVLARRTPAGLSARDAANSMARSRSLSGQTASSRPDSRAVSASIVAPDRMSSAAASNPMRRGRRCVPPPPGISPRVISGSPSRHPASATRPWHASASSSPPPSAWPCSAATTGLRHDSITAGTSIASAAPFARVNSRISAPATNVLPSHASTTARTAGSASASRSAEHRPARTVSDSALIGGLSTLRTATFRCRATLTTGLMCSKSGFVILDLPPAGWKCYV
ncbi:Uncharacterised protein [Bordetella pertussis]|nr:Uncharacterised protein [Bordetella pertussis]